MTVEKRGNNWCVVHGHPQKAGSKTDKAPGTPIHCYSIDKLGEAEARRRAEAMHAAIVHSEAQAKHEGDSLVLRNQPVSREGVLDYHDENGALVRKFKRWDDLKENIGRVVPILDEHPPANNGNGGLYSGKETIQGWATLKQYKNIHELAADMVLEDFAPLKQGYSSGYPYYPLEEPGTAPDGKEYDMIQAKMLIDHVALTDGPRDDLCVLLAGDGLKSDLGLAVGADSNVPPNRPDAAFKCRIGYDSVRFDVARKNEIRDLLKKDNPDLDDKRLTTLVEKMFADEQHHPRTLQKKGVKKHMSVNEAEAPTNAATAGDAAETVKLRAEVAKLQAEKAVLEARKDSDAKVAALQKSYDALKAERDALLQNQVDSMLSYLVAHDYKKDSFNGKSRDYINGAYDIALTNSKGADTGVPASDKKEDGDADDIHDIDSSRFVMNTETGLMEYKTADGDSIPLSQLDVKGKRRPAPK